jgi:enoyl-CoA hydratase
MSAWHETTLPLPTKIKETLSVAEILIRRAGPIGTVVLSNVDKYNAMTSQMWHALPSHIAELDADPSIRAIVLTGDGDKAFVSGADISQFGAERTDPVAQQRYNEAVYAAYAAPIQASKPTIAQIRGICMGGGLGLAAACDIRICSDDARFRMPAARLGLGYNQAGVHRFISLIGVQNTYDIFFSGRIFNADEALRMGFVSRVVPPGQLEEAVQSLTSAIADNAPLTAKALKLTVNAFLENPAERNSASAQAAIAACNASEDYREGVRAFEEKRKPRFVGR